MSESKGSVKQDVVVLVLVAGYFGVTYASINQDYSSGYESIRDYFIFQSGLQAFFQLLLIWFELRGNITWLVSIRSAAFFWLFGMSVINIFLGLLSVWLILYLGIAGYLHITLFFESLEASSPYSHRDDEVYFRSVDINRDVASARLKRFST
jgi:hypothetical protein